MNILKFATLDFVNKKIYFSHANRNNSHCSSCANDWLMLRVQTCQIHYPTSASESTPVQPPIRLLNTDEPPEVCRATTASQPESSYDVTTVNDLLPPVAATQARSGDIPNIVENNDNNDQSCIDSVQMYDVNDDVICDHNSQSVEDNSVNVHLNQNLDIPSNTLMTISVAVNKKIKNNADLLIYPNVIKKSVVLASVLTHTKSSNVTIQLANLSNEEIKLKTGTKLSEGIYVDNEHVTIAKLETPSQHDCTKLPPLVKDDIKCDNAQVHDKLLKITNKFRIAYWLFNKPIRKFRGISVNEDKIDLKKRSAIEGKQPLV